MKLQEFTDLKDTCPVCSSNLILKLTDRTDDSHPIHMNVDQLIGMSIIKCHHRNLSIFVNLKQNKYVYANQQSEAVVLTLDILCKQDKSHYIKHALPFSLSVPSTRWLDLPSIELE